MQIDLTAIKAAARKTAFAVRQLAHEEGQGAGETARDHFLASRLHTGAKVISAYRPIRTELDPTPLMVALHRAGHRLCVPVIVGEGQPLEFHEWWPEAPMKPGPFGAEVPDDTHVLLPDLILAPLLCFDARGYRLGYGGGFYDRTLEGLRATRKVRAYGFAYAAQQIERVPTEPTDQLLDGIVTETGILRPAGGTP